MLTIKLVYPLDETGRTHYEVWKQMQFADNNLWCLVEYGWLVGGTTNWVEKVILDPTWEPEWDHPGHFPDSYKIDKGVCHVAKTLEEFVEKTYGMPTLRIPQDVREVVVL